MPKKISDLTAISSLVSADYVEISRNGTSSVRRDLYDEFSDNTENIKGLIWNIGLAESRSASAVTIFFKQKDGSSDLGAGVNRGRIGFRSTTQTSGGYAVIDGIATTSTTINAGNTIGFFASKDEDLHIYSYNDAGTLKIAYAGSWSFDESVLQNITAQSTVATVKTTLFAATAATGVAIRYMGKITYNLATPGTWVTAPTLIVNTPIMRKQAENGVIASTGNGRGTTDTVIRRITNTTNIGNGTAVTHATSAANGSTFTINEDGLYSIEYSDGDSAAVITIGVSLNSNQLTTAIASITAANRLQFKRVDTSGGASVDVLAIVRRLKVGDIIRPHLNSATSGDATTHCFFIVRKIGD
jgi:hypothetical protein